MLNLQFIVISEKIHECAGKYWFNLVHDRHYENHIPINQSEMSGIYLAFRSIDILCGVILIILITRNLNGQTTDSFKWMTLISIILSKVLVHCTIKIDNKNRSILIFFKMGDSPEMSGGSISIYQRLNIS